ncbi:MAG TPA: membrane protein insertase YidC [Candidatus Ligilactobacillus avistercoris]|nr:membrane protein insertase YidC [Candidatus Ligilactobacillus avistercoris]
MKHKKKLLAVATISSIALLLGGCVRRDAHGHPVGWTYTHLAVPTQHLLNWLAHLLGGSYGWSIILITFAVRLILMPIMVQQSKKATVQQVKMQAIQPYMQQIQEKMQHVSSQDEQMALSQQLMQLYKRNDISMTGGMGCLPLLIQLPIFAALYAAIQYSPELSRSTFMGVNLGHRCFWLVMLSFLIYALQGWLATIGVPKEQKKMMSAMMLYSPIMIGFMTYISPAGLGLYFFVGGIFACLQTLIIVLMRPRIEKRLAAEFEVVPPEPITLPKEEPAEHEQQPTGPSNRERNAGKQHRQPSRENEPRKNATANQPHQLSNRERNAGKQHRKE